MKKILVVDDENSIRTAVTLVLNDRGYETLEADNGAAAYDIAVTERPDLIISDVMMDNGNGFFLTELLGKGERTATIPVILMTGAAQGAGAWNSDEQIQYLQKPFTADILLRAIRNAIS